MEEIQTKQSVQINIHHLSWLLADNGHKYWSTLSPFMKKTKPQPTVLVGNMSRLTWPWLSGLDRCLLFQCMMLLKDFVKC